MGIEKINVNNVWLTLEELNTVIILHRVYISPSHRGNGYLKKAIDWLKEDVIPKKKNIYLTIMPDREEFTDRLRTFFNIQGFNPESDGEDIYRNDLYFFYQ